MPRTIEDDDDDDDDDDEEEEGSQAGSSSSSSDDFEGNADDPLELLQHLRDSMRSVRWRIAAAAPSTPRLRRHPPPSPPSQSSDRSRPLSFPHPTPHSLASPRCASPLRSAGEEGGAARALTREQCADRPRGERAQLADALRPHRGGDINMRQHQRPCRCSGAPRVRGRGRWEGRGESTMHARVSPALHARAARSLCRMSRACLPMRYPMRYPCAQIKDNEARCNTLKALVRDLAANGVRTGGGTRGGDDFVELAEDPHTKAKKKRKQRQSLAFSNAGVRAQSQLVRNMAAEPVRANTHTLAHYSHHSHL